MTNNIIPTAKFKRINLNNPYAAIATMVVAGVWGIVTCSNNNRHQ